MTLWLVLMSMSHRVRWNCCEAPRVLEVIHSHFYAKGQKLQELFEDDRLDRKVLHEIIAELKRQSTPTAQALLKRSRPWRAFSCPSRTPLLR